MKIILSTIIAVISGCCSLGAQEIPVLDDLFQWFPEGKYESVEHLNLADIRENEAFLKYCQENELICKSMVAMKSLPDQLVAEFESVTSMKRVKILVYKGKERRPMAVGDVSTLYQAGDQWYSTISSGQWLLVYRFQDLDTLLKPLIKDGYFQAYGKKLFDRDVYQMQCYSLDGKFDRFYYATPGNELLVAPDYKTILKMIGAGYGTELSILADFPFPRVRDYLPISGQWWKLVNHQPHNKAKLAKMEKDEVAEDILDLFRDALKENDHLQITDLKFHDYHERRTIKFFTDDEEAREYLSRQAEMIKRHPAANSEIGKVRQDNIETIREGSMVVRSMHFTPDYLKAMEEWENDPKNFKYIKLKKKEDEDEEKS